MECLSPPELNDRELVAAAEGDPSARVREHLAQCPACRARMGEFARLAGGLRARLYRLDCPPADELSELGMGLLAAARSRAVTDHLSDCLHCRRELAQLESYLDSLAPELELSLAERVQVLVARLVRGSQGPISGLAPAGVRGDAGETLIYEAGAAQIALELLPAADQPGRRELLGLITGGPSEGVTASLFRAGQQVAAAEVDATGNFVLADLVAGTYELRLSGPNLEIQIHELLLP